MKIFKLVLLRHGESIWNKENKFTGWTDVSLSRSGRAEAKNAGILLSKEQIKFDYIYTSLLKRNRSLPFLFIRKVKFYRRIFWQLPNTSTIANM